MTSTVAPSLSGRRTSRWPLLLAWLLLTGVLLAIVPGLPWQRAVDQIRHSNGGWVATAVTANALILPLWAAEWRLFVPAAFRVAYSRMFEVVSVTAAVLNSVPFFAGEASGVALLIERAQLSRGAALSVLAMDQLLVGFAKLTVIAAAALVAPLPGWLRAGILSLVLGVAALSAVLLPLALRWSEVRDRLVARPSRARMFAARVIAWGAHFDALREPRRLLKLGLLALTKKGAELLAIMAIQMAFGLEPSIGSALLVLAALSITTLLPVAPANLGVYEATVFATYRFLGLSADTAVGIAIVQHLAFLLPGLATGYLTLTLRQLLRPRA